MGPGVTVPPLVRVAELVAPTPDPVPGVSGVVNPPAKSSANHISGDVTGRRATYGDVQAVTWYTGKAAGRDLRNGGRFGPRGLSGIEDGGASVKH